MINDVDATRLSAKETAALRRREIGIVFQQPNLLASLTALEQLELMGRLGSRPRGGARAATTAKARDLLAAVGLSAKARTRPGELSGGERQRVNIARAFMNDPSVMVVDEPTSALDQARGGAIIELVIDLTRTHDVATLLVTHDQAHLPAMDAVYTMVDGVLTTRRSAEAVEGAATAALVV
jgi:putative ABC transport system ATP-binding protein